MASYEMNQVVRSTCNVVFGKGLEWQIENYLVIAISFYYNFFWPSKVFNVL